MAQRLVLGLSTIRFYESNRRQIRASELLKVAKAYDISNDEILVYLEQIAK